MFGLSCRSILHKLEHRDNFCEWQNIIFLGWQVILLSNISSNVLWGLTQPFFIFPQSLQNVWPPLFKHDGGGSDIIYDKQSLGDGSGVSSWVGIWYVTVQDIHSDGREMLSINKHTLNVYGNIYFSFKYCHKQIIKLKAHWLTQVTQSIKYYEIRIIVEIGGNSATNYQYVHKWSEISTWWILILKAVTTR